ncbi:MAG: helicase-related protein [Candidatus Bilamarchaeaceae archaeon]
MMSVSLSPTLRLIKLELDQMTKEYSRLLGAVGFPPPLKSKGEFMKMREKIMNIPHSIKYTAIVYYSILMNLMHMSELIETQGIHALRSYTEKLKTKETKSAAALMGRKEYIKMLQYLQTDEEHPKLKLLLDILQKDFSGKKAIIFAQYRDQIAKINDELNKSGYRAKIFVGKKDGVTRKMQEETIAEFREGKFDFLVASSIGEEGLDIPAVDAVIFYEPIPSEIRSIQRRGRTGRFGKGKVLILMTKDTRDEYYFWASRRREKNMKRILYSMAGKKPEREFVKASELKAGKKEDVAIKPESRPSSGQSKISDF